MKYIKFVSLCFSLCFLSSCEYHVLDNTRLEFSGKIVNAAEEPLINCFVYLEGGEYNGKILGKDYSNTYGEFHFVSLSTTPSANHLHIKPQNEDYVSVSFHGIANSKNLGTIQLRNKAVFNLKIEPISPNSSNSISWKISYTLPHCAYYYNEGGVAGSIRTNCYEMYSNEEYYYQSPENPTFTDSYQSVMGGTVKLTYFINQQPTQKVEIIIDIDQPHEAYRLTY